MCIAYSGTVHQHGAANVMQVIFSYRTGIFSLVHYVMPVPCCGHMLLCAVPGHTHSTGHICSK